VRAAARAREKASMTRAAAWLGELGVGQYAQASLLGRADEVIE
jgi:hypothetical protein